MNIYRKNKEEIKDINNKNVPRNNKLSFKKQNNGNSFLREITKKINTIRFEFIKIDEINRKYSLEYNINDFHKCHNYFKNFMDINELFNLKFKNLRNEELLINQENEDEILFRITVIYNKCKEEIKFIIKEADRYREFSDEISSDEEWNQLKKYNKLDNKNKRFNKIIKNKKLNISSFFKLIILFYILILIMPIRNSIFNLFKINTKYILFLDEYFNDYVNANDAYPIFNYYRRKGRKEAYYFVLKDSQLHKQLLKENNLNNIIVVENYLKNKKNFTKTFSYFIPKSQLMVYAYINKYLSDIIKNTNNQLKTIYLDHGCIYFKETLFKNYLKIEEEKRVTVKIKPEYDNWLKHGWKENQLYKVGLPRWERFNHIQNQHNAILIMFTWRYMRKKQFLKSTFYKRIDELFSNDDFINYFRTKNIKIFYKRHHQELSRTKGYHKYYNNNYIHEVNDNENFSQIIDNSSLFITDFSTLCFDFMFQNKPVLFYLLDNNDPNLSKKDKYNAKYLKEKMIFGNLYNSSKDLIEKIKYYVNNNFTLEENIKDKYNSLFYVKKNIFKNLEKVFDQIIEEK